MFPCTCRYVYGLCIVKCIMKLNYGGRGLQGLVMDFVGLCRAMAGHEGPGGRTSKPSGHPSGGPRAPWLAGLRGNTLL